ncbi:MAG: response regulator [Gammaproteobacteria bacterium]|nr:response regulator [Gammaproteobacteria bacterium]MDH5734688.1 response regulator [Gammaproteobacteria bacterium]
MNNSSNATILVVDDDPLILQMLQVHLESEGFNSILAENGQQALKSLAVHGEHIQAIISDVEMPELNGYELCEAIRANDCFQSLPFIFVSAHTDLDERLKGYSVGGDEYISKPIDAEEVIIKVRHIINNRIQHDSLNQQVQESFRTAMHAMTYSGRLGQVLGFLKEATHITTFDDLAMCLFETLESLGLNAVIQFHIRMNLLPFRKNGKMTPLESNVMELARREGRFFDFGARTIINYADFSLLVKNMPVDNPDDYGAIKDILGNLCDAVEVLVKLLSSKEVTEEKKHSMLVADEALAEVKSSLQMIQAENEQAIENMIGEMEDAMISLGLTDAQEEILRSITFQFLEDSTRAFEQVKALYQSFEEIHKTLKQ